MFARKQKPYELERTDVKLCNIARQISTKYHKLSNLTLEEGGTRVTLTLTADDFGYLARYLESVTNVRGDN